MTTTHLIGDSEWATCLCGNEPHKAGFYPCTVDGLIVEPTPEEWTTNLYVCSDCGLYFDNDTLAIVGVADVIIKRRNDRYWNEV